MPSFSIMAIPYVTKHGRVDTTAPSTSLASSLRTSARSSAKAKVHSAGWRFQVTPRTFSAPIRRRGSGIADELMEATEAELVKSGVSEGELHCVVGNDRARRFYERLGWVSQGEFLEETAGSEDGVSFWRMTKTLA